MPPSRTRRSCSSRLMEGIVGNMKGCFKPPTIEHHSPLAFDQRLRLYDGVFVREGVEGREQQIARPRFDGDEPEGGESQPVVWLEVVQQSPFGPVAEYLVVDVEEDLLRQRFDLETGLIA